MAIILALLISISGYIAGSSGDVITQDVVDAIRQNVEELKKKVDTLQTTVTNHRLIPAHPNSDENIKNIMKHMDKIDDRLRELERQR